MKTNIVIIIVIIIVVAFASFFLFSNRAEAPQNTSGEAVQTSEETTENATPKTEETPVSSTEETPSSETTKNVVVVTYTDNGFGQDTVTIRKGDTVRFLNESSGKMWVASNVHPTHSQYPEKTSTDCLGSVFDECAGNVKGESWEFTFNQVGSWGYHNHMRASKTGTVVVQ